MVGPHPQTRPARQPGPPVHDDLVEPRFTTTAPDRLWLTDITEHLTAESKLYLCAVKEVWSSRIDEHSIAARMTAKLAVDALNDACAPRTSPIASRINVATPWKPPASYTVVVGDTGTMGVGAPRPDRGEPRPVGPVLSLLGRPGGCSVSTRCMTEGPSRDTRLNEDKLARVRKCRDYG